MRWLNDLARPEIINLQAYASARSEFNGNHYVQLDANENPQQPYGNETGELNRYPEPQPEKLRQKLADLYGIAIENLLLTRGMDEGIDLLIRSFCRPYQDAIAITPPTFGYYEVAATINGALIAKLPLEQDFLPNWEQLSTLKNTKLIFLCSPNNPTGQLIPLADIQLLCQRYQGVSLVVVDEAYIEFSDSESATTLLATCRNLVVMRTLSKAYALAGNRLGAVIAHADIIALLRKVISPYPIPRPCTESALRSLTPIGLAYSKAGIEKIKQQRDYLLMQLRRSPKIKQIYPSAANFLLVIAVNAECLYQELKSQGIVVRKRMQDIPEALRITVGSAQDNQLLLTALGLTTATAKPIRQACRMRKTQETEVLCELRIDDKGESDIQTGIGFFDHMLEQLARHSGISLTIHALGDTHIDVHHTVEDVAIVLGMALKAALNNKRGIQRYGFVLPMDEAEAKVSIDLGGRGYCDFNATFSSMQVGTFPVEMIQHFFATFSDHLGAAVHIAVTGNNTHHMIEAIFKCTAMALRQAVMIRDEQLPSTKGVL